MIARMSSTRISLLGLARLVDAVPASSAHCHCRANRAPRAAHRATPPARQGEFGPRTSDSWHKCRTAGGFDRMAVRPHKAEPGPTPAPVRTDQRLPAREATRRARCPATGLEAKAPQAKAGAIDRRHLPLPGLEYPLDLTRNVRQIVFGVDPGKPPGRRLCTGLVAAANSREEIEVLLFESIRIASHRLGASRPCAATSRTTVSSPAENRPAPSARAASGCPC